MTVWHPTYFLIALWRQPLFWKKHEFCSSLYYFLTHLEFWGIIAVVSYTLSKSLPLLALPLGAPWCTWSSQGPFYFALFFTSLCLFWLEHMWLWGAFDWQRWRKQPSVVEDSSLPSEGQQVMWAGWSWHFCTTLLTLLEGRSHLALLWAGGLLYFNLHIHYRLLCLFLNPMLSTMACASFLVAN
jgi:hypothetical protein